MKKIFLSLALFMFFTSLFAQRVETKTPSKKAEKQVEKKQVENKLVDATIDFESKVVDYGVLENGVDGNRKFVFKNNGSEPLVIKNAKGSCGCTVPTWPRDPIGPGETSEIGVKYDTKRVGKFTKTITLTTNADKKPVILTIKGEVKPAPKDAQTPERKQGGAPLEKK